MAERCGEEDGAEGSPVFEVCGGLEGEFVQIGSWSVGSRGGRYLARQGRSGGCSVGIFAWYWGRWRLLFGE